MSPTGGACSTKPQGASPPYPGGLQQEILLPTISSLILEGFSGELVVPIVAKPSLEDRSNISIKDVDIWEYRTCPLWTNLLSEAAI